jgi:hypothetical protein
MSWMNYEIIKIKYFPDNICLPINILIIEGKLSRKIWVLKSAQNVILWIVILLRTLFTNIIQIFKLLFKSSSFKCKSNKDQVLF